VICNEEDTDGRARVTTDEEPVLHVDWTEVISCYWCAGTVSVEKFWWRFECSGRRKDWWMVRVNEIIDVVDTAWHTLVVIC